VALGARIVEVHFTDRRAGRSFRDHQLSFEPDELAALVKAIRAVAACLGQYGKTRAEAELPSLRAVRKGVVAARNLAAGTVLTGDDLMFARPASEFAASEIGEIVGKRLALDLVRGQPIPRGGVRLP
jgi:N-acetylneuraminate synthase/N,N'-diacetyllegionaminate synthase